MTDKTKPGRARTGTVIKVPSGPYKGHLQGIVTLGDGKTRKRLKPFPKRMSLEMAKEKTAHFAEQYADVMPKAKAGATAPALAEDLGSTPMGKWVATWNADRVRRGYTTTRENLTHYRMHIRPVLGDRHVKDWTREDLRRLSRALDTKVQAKELSWKTAVNVWGTATKMCDDSTESKLDDVRCRQENPAPGVRGPERGDAVGLQWLYPSEFLTFVACPEVPLMWRRVAAVAVYMYPRDGELRVLLCRDVDAEHQTAHITKALDKRADPPRVTTTKGGRNRHVPLEVELVPLLAALKKEQGDKGPLFPEFPSERDMARGLRRWLRRAGVRRHELHHRTPTTRPLRFHDLRATGCTWMAVRGDDPLKIQARAGHTEFDTTQKYIRLAEVLRDGFGDVFPPLPKELCEVKMAPETIARIDRGSLSTRNVYRKSGADGTRNGRSPVTTENHSEVTSGGSAELPLSEGAKPATVGDDRFDSDRETDHQADPVELALASALERASAAGQWTAVEVLSRELAARRLARTAPDVPTLEGARAKREGKA